MIFWLQYSVLIYLNWWRWKSKPKSRFGEQTLVAHNVFDDMHEPVSIVTLVNWYIFFSGPCAYSETATSTKGALDGRSIPRWLNINFILVYCGSLHVVIIDMRLINPDLFDVWIYTFPTFFFFTFYDNFPLTQWTLYLFTDYIYCIFNIWCYWSGKLTIHGLYILHLQHLMLLVRKTHHSLVNDCILYWIAES